MGSEMCIRDSGSTTGGGTGGTGDIAYLSFNNRTYIRINGKFCANDEGFVDNQHTYTPLTDAQFAELTALEQFPGLPCNDPGSAN